MPGAADTEGMTDAPAPAEGEAAPPTETKKKKKGWNPMDVVKDVTDKIP
jgi:hypothetical protein